MAGVQACVAEQIGAGLGSFGAREAVQDPAVRGCAARHRLDVAELGVGESETDGGDRAATVGRFEDDQPAAGADEGRTGTEKLVQRVVEAVGSGQALGELVQRGEVGDPTGQTVLEKGSWRGRHTVQRPGSVR